MRPRADIPRPDADGDRLLSTGEAARLLSCSRQHVVDLCNRGELSFTTTGKHRRVRRRDVDAIRTRTERMSRDQKRSLWLAYALAGRIVADPVRARRVACVMMGRFTPTKPRSAVSSTPTASGSTPATSMVWARCSRGERSARPQAPS